jgi:hypothetical protein
VVSPAFSTKGFKSATLSFQRFLGVRAADSVSIHVCVYFLLHHLDVQVCSVTTAKCFLVWSNSQMAVMDTAWRGVQYVLPAAVMDQPAVQVRGCLPVSI